MNKILTFLLFLSFGFVQAQQLNCIVTVNAQSLSNPNQQVFKTLQTALSEFVNNTDWTGSPLKQNEKINCSMYLTITSNNSDQFSGTIQVQSSRLIYNSTYASPVFNFKDDDLSFRYTEFENLVYNPNGFESNLVSVITFYTYVILGMDADTFTPALGGSPYFETAQNIANVAQQGGFKGWSPSDGMRNRYIFINDMLSPAYSDLRQCVYEYHAGLDMMNKDLKSAKEKIGASLLLLGKLHETRPNAFLTQVFFDAKSDEIVSVFTGGPSVSITDLVENLNRVSSKNSTKWERIKY